jgi:alpha-tubulin suppressor-like RCC1 family protein
LQVIGDNQDGQAGVDGASSITSPTNAALVEVQLLSAGADHSCAVTTDGAIWCWGDNSHGQMGNGTISTTPSSIPTRVQWSCP